MKEAMEQRGRELCVLLAAGSKGRARAEEGAVVKVEVPQARGHGHLDLHNGANLRT